MLELAASTVLWPDGTLAPGVVSVDAGRVVSVRPPDTAAVPDRILCPGFVDIQVNGHDDVDVSVADGPQWDRMDDLLVAQGVTSWLPTLVTSTAAARRAALDRIAAASRRAGARPSMLGVHLEGPWLGTRAGAHRSDLIRPLTTDAVAGLPDLVRLVTVCPVGPDALEAIAALVADGRVVSMGHSDASHAEASAAVDVGATLVTHVFNASSPLHHREPGLAGTALADDRLAVSLIADGVHLHPAVVSVVARAKPRGRLVLITDAVAWRTPGARDRGIRVVEGAPRTEAGVLAGSSLTMDAAVRSTVAWGALDLASALIAASAAPAQVVGAEDRGILAPGRRADVITLTPDLAIEHVWIEGEQVR
ncbi:MAG: N-acetylglucosamine-6-phosphate deacetylase [Acidimicrobiales bacterium]